MINSVVIFVLLPLFAGAVLLAVSYLRRLSLIISCVLLSALFVAAMLAPRGLILDWMDKPYEIRTSLVLLGRTFKLPPHLFSFCGLAYLVGLLWSLCTGLFKVKANFNAMSLIIPSLLVMMVTVEPFLYSAVIFEILALLVIRFSWKRKRAQCVEFCILSCCRRLPWFWYF